DRLQVALEECFLAGVTLDLAARRLRDRAGLEEDDAVDGEVVFRRDGAARRGNGFRGIDLRRHHTRFSDGLLTLRGGERTGERLDLRIGFAAVRPAPCDLTG